jgi:predicted DNA-binding transcriptional regulator YafY
MTTRDDGRNRALKRVLMLAKRLQAARKPPRLEALADEFRVSTRTIRRDIAALDDAGWPVQRSA